MREDELGGVGDGVSECGEVGVGMEVVEVGEESGDECGEEGGGDGA